MNKWDMRFLELAQHVATWSKDPSTQVGAVIVRPDRTIASVGYNGFPRGVIDEPERYAEREVKYKMVVHAEANAILSAREPLHGYTCYVLPLAPCSSCAAMIIQSGIQRVVTTVERWEGSAQTMFQESGVTIVATEQRVFTTTR